jgi:hypothetical protein
VLRVRSCVADSPAAAVLASGDMILQINGRPVTCFGDVDEALAAAAEGKAAGSGGGAGEGGGAPASKRRRGGSTGGRGAAAAQRRGKAKAKEDGEAAPAEGEQQEGKPVAAAVAESGGDGAATNGVHASGGEQQQEAAAAGAGGGGGGGEDGQPPTEVTLTIFDKSRAVRDVVVHLQQECGMGTSRLVHWAGAQLQAPHRAVRELGFLPPGGAGVYISRCARIIFSRPAFDVSNTQPEPSRPRRRLRPRPNPGAGARAPPRRRPCLIAVGPASLPLPPFPPLPAVRQVAPWQPLT